MYRSLNDSDQATEGFVMSPQEDTDLDEELAALIAERTKPLELSREQLEAHFGSEKWQEPEIYEVDKDQMKKLSVLAIEHFSTEGCRILPERALAYSATFSFEFHKTSIGTSVIAKCRTCDKTFDISHEF